MKRKINLYFLLVTFMGIVLTLLLSTFAYYELFKKEIIKDLETYIEVLKDSKIFEQQPVETTESFGKLRITLIDEDGTVEYDNQVAAGNLDKHNTRPEVLEAFENGSGYEIRTSKTLNKSTFYYAIQLDNGCVLRVAKEADSIWSVFVGILPVIALILVLLFVVSFLLTHYLTRSIVRPIEHMANHLDEMSEVDSYKELQPFISMIVKQHEDILKNAEIRQEFTANVSHELKTPLTSISGYSELIETGMATDEDVIRFAGEIHHSSNRLLTLINDIIRLSELDGVTNELLTERVELYHTAQTAIDMLQFHADKHGICLRIEGEVTYIEANKVMMEELVYNLIENAIRYNNENGHVRVLVYHTDDGRACFCVQDTGIGISKEHQERIFERFYRVDKSRSKSRGGTGLGLAIVKHIVAQHQASIEIESEIGKGTTVRVLFQKEKSCQ